jgi:SET domain-containing protein
MMLIQHSRKPNIKISFDGGQAMIRLFAENSLAKGDELFMNYTDLYAQDEVSQESHFDDAPSMQNMDLEQQIYAQL